MSIDLELAPKAKRPAGAVCCEALVFPEVSVVHAERLAEIADTGDGWDVLHLSGHGGPGLFVLEHADGSPDPVAVADSGLDRV